MVVGVGAGVVLATASVGVTKITFKGQVVEVGPEQTVLEALLDDGHDVLYSCLSGACHTCALVALDGDPGPRAQKGLKVTWQHQGIFLACQCHPTEPMTVCTRLPQDEPFYVPGQPNQPLLCVAGGEQGVEVMAEVIQSALQAGHHGPIWLLLLDERGSDGLSMSAKNLEIHTKPPEEAAEDFVRVFMDGVGDLKAARVYAHAPIMAALGVQRLAFVAGVPNQEVLVWFKRNFRT